MNPKSFLKVFSVIFAAMIVSANFSNLARAQGIKGANSLGRTPTEILPQFGLSGPAQSVAISPDGMRAITTRFSDEALLWDLATGRELRRFVGHKGTVLAVAFSPDERTAFTASLDGSARQWDIASGREVQRFSSSSSSISVSPDGSKIVTGWFGDSIARIWDVRSGQQLSQLSGHTNSITSVAFSPDGKIVATGGRDNTARLWNSAGKEFVRLVGHPVSSVAFSPDGRALVTGSNDNSATVWDVKSGQQIRQLLGHTKEVSSAIFSGDGQSVITSSCDGTVRIWSLASGSELRRVSFSYSGRYGAIPPEVTSCLGQTALSSDGKFALTGKWDDTARLWDVASGHEIQKLVGATSGLTSMAQSPTGTELLTGSSSGQVSLWDEAGRRGKEFAGNTSAVSAVAFSPDNSMVAAGSLDGNATVWDRNTGRLLRQIRAHKINSIAFAPDGRSILLADVNAILHWDIAIGKVTRQLVGHSGEVISVSVSLDGRYVLSGGIDKTARLWDLNTGKEIRQLVGHTAAVTAVVFMPSSSAVTTASVDGTVRTWDMLSGNELWKLAWRAPVDAIAISSDAKLVVSGSRDQLAELWDVESGRSDLQFQGAMHWVTAVAFSPRGDAVLSTSLDGAIRRWSLKSGALLGSMVSFRDGGWLTITPEGFFDASSPKAAQNLNVVRGLEVSSIDQVYNALYRPDLVREKLAGDPNGKVKAAAAQLDLEKVMASGSAPKVAIASPVSGVVSSVDEVEVQATITGQGGGIGKVEWRVNGVTLGVESRGLDRIDSGNGGAGKPSAAVQTVKRKLALERGDNRIEVLAYNGKGLIASEAAQITIKWDGEKTATPPKLYVLAVGVNDYYDSRLRLAYAVPDATALAEGVTKVLDADVTLANMDKVFSELGGKVQPRDVFVFFLAGHGKTKNGRYYFLPRDFRYEDENSIEKAGMDQDRFQAWFARIGARKSILLYDTCESGSLTGNTRGSDIDERLGALNRMARATGRTFLTATTDDAPALEGYHGHGVFTYALLDALDHADVNKNGLIEVSELADYIDQKVPDFSFEAFKLRQIPQRSIVGNNFALANKAEVLSGAAANTRTDPALALSKPTHVVVAPADVYEKVAGQGAKIEQLPVGTLLSIVKTDQGWAVVARNGNPIGYVAQDRLARVQ